MIAELARSERGRRTLKSLVFVASLAPAAVQIAKSMQKVAIKVPWTSTWALVAPNFLKRVL